MIVRSKAPLRIGLAGGGTDVSPYSELYGGAVLNATISLYAHATLEPLDERLLTFSSGDQHTEESYKLNEKTPATGKLNLLKGVYNRIRKDYDPLPGGLKLSTKVDVPAGSGLGTSSTLVVAVAAAFREKLKLSMNAYDLAHYAYDIERKDLHLAGGKQDQYAAAFGGINFMEFFENEKVVVSPVCVEPEILSALENNLLLYYTMSTRDSIEIINRQAENVRIGNQESINAMHSLKDQARMMKEALVKGRLNEIGEILDFGFEQKRKMADGISNSRLEEIYDSAIKAGAGGGKISGAGGGGFMIFYCPAGTKNNVIKKLESFGGKVYDYRFTGQGVTAWTA